MSSFKTRILISLLVATLMAVSLSVPVVDAQSDVIVIDESEFLTAWNANAVNPPEKLEELTVELQEGEIEISLTAIPRNSEAVSLTAVLVPVVNQGRLDWVGTFASVTGPHHDGIPPLRITDQQINRLESWLERTAHAAFGFDVWVEDKDMYFQAVNISSTSIEAVVSSREAPRGPETRTVTEDQLNGLLSSVANRNKQIESFTVDFQDGLLAFTLVGVILDDTEGQESRTVEIAFVPVTSDDGQVFAEETYRSVDGEPDRPLVEGRIDSLSERLGSLLNRLFFLPELDDEVLVNVTITEETIVVEKVE